MAERGIGIVKRVISVLDSVDYARYSKKKARTYLEYASDTCKDERKLICPIMFPRFVEQILGFRLGETIGTQEASPEGGDIPDYIPADTRTHPFVFDCKGMDTLDLSTWYGQIKRYVETQDVKYGILVNMRDLDVYTLESEEEIEAFNFSLVELYEDFKEDPATVLERDNTRRFLRFVEFFRYTPLTLEQKFNRVAEAKCWIGTETLNIGLLTKRLRHIVECIYEDARSRQGELHSLKEIDTQRAIGIAQEIAVIASEIERGRKIEEATLQTFDEIFKASPKSLLGKALDLFFRRVGYFTMTRLLLARAWEDIDFIDQSLYDGGLAKWYENFDREIRRVLKYAFDLASERYRWLFNVDNNYSWYEPSDETLVEALYELSNVYLGKLDQDVLGTIYEEYIDKLDKRQKGQYYTPREIVEFIWDRVGFTRDEDFFSYKEGKREPRLILDPATGSGGFLVEAVRRIREDSKIDYATFNDVLDLRTSILTGTFGSEISPFPYYITEVNLLIQLTPVIKRMMDLRKRFRGKGTPALGIVPVDALSLYNPEQLALEPEEYEFDRIRDLLPLESQKRVIFEKIKSGLDREFSYCCANPPYVGEKGNKELFRASLERFPYWRRFYQGKMDYLYFFIILGLSKLRSPNDCASGGKLGFITTAYWPTADGASGLRKYILENSKIREMIFFEDVKIFEYAKGQHSMVFVLEKCPGRDGEVERAANEIKVVQVVGKHQEIPGDSIREKLEFLTRHIQRHMDKREWEDNYIKVFVCATKQGELTNEPWGILVDESSAKMIRQIEAVGTKLKEHWNIEQGAVPSPLRLTKSKLEELPKGTVQKHNLKIGDGVFVVTKEELDNLSLAENEYEIMKPYFKNSDVSRYITSRDTTRYLIYTTSATKIDDYPNVRRHLEKFRYLLEKRLSRYGESYNWFELHRSRDQTIFEGAKIVCSYRAEEASFAYNEGDFYGSTDMYFIKPRDPNDRHSLKYLVAVLNSKVVDFWLSKKGKSKGGITEQFATPLENLYVRRIDFKDPAEVKIHDDLVKLVDEIIEVRRRLSEFDVFFPTVRLTQLPGSVPLPDVNPEAIVAALACEKRFSLRTHPDTVITCGTDVGRTGFVLHKVGKVQLTLEGPQLELIGKGRKGVIIAGPEELLHVVSLVLQEHRHEPWSSVKELPVIPETAEAYEAKKEEVTGEVVALRTEIARLQVSIDEMVLGLYGISEDSQKNSESEETMPGKTVA